MTLSEFEVIARQFEQNDLIYDQMEVFMRVYEL